VPGAAWAQDSPPSIPQIGVQLGVGPSTLIESGASPIVGLFVGGFYAPNPNPVTWQIEGVIEWHGARVGETTIRLLDLKVPALVRVNIRGMHRTAWHVLAGPSIAYRGRASLSATGGTIDVTGGTPAIHYGVVVQAGVRIGNTGGAVRFTQSLNFSGFIVDEQETRSRAIMAVVTFRLQ
jgi:hypothetical protein